MQEIWQIIAEAAEQHWKILAPLAEQTPKISWIGYFNAICNVSGIVLIVWLIRDRRILAQANIALGRRIAEIEAKKIETLKSIEEAQ